METISDMANLTGFLQTIPKCEWCIWRMGLAYIFNRNISMMTIRDRVCGDDKNDDDTEKHDVI